MNVDYRRKLKKNFMEERRYLINPDPTFSQKAGYILFVQTWIHWTKDIQCMVGVYLHVRSIFFILFLLLFLIFSPSNYSIHIYCLRRCLPGGHKKWKSWRQILLWIYVCTAPSVRNTKGAFGDKIQARQLETAQEKRGGRHLNRKGIMISKY